MAHWSECAVTNAGIEMLNEWMAGRFIRITSAYGGTDRVRPELLAQQTGLINRKQKLHIIGEENGPTGKVVQLQISNHNLANEYALSQIGVYAKLDPDKDPDSEEKLLFIMQDTKGVTIPSSEEPPFLLELFCAIEITNNGRFQVTIDKAGIVTFGHLSTALERAIGQHNADEAAHPEIENRILRMLMLGEVHLPLSDHDGNELCTRDEAVIDAVKKLEERDCEH